MTAAVGMILRQTQTQYPVRFQEGHRSYRPRVAQDTADIDGIGPLDENQLGTIIWQKDWAKEENLSTECDQIMSA